MITLTFHKIHFLTVFRDFYTIFGHLLLNQLSEIGFKKMDVLFVGNYIGSSWLLASTIR